MPRCGSFPESRIVAGVAKVRQRLVYQSNPFFLRPRRISVALPRTTQVYADDSEAGNDPSDALSTFYWAAGAAIACRDGTNMFAISERTYHEFALQSARWLAFELVGIGLQR